ncbi:LytTR family DNA-binding domain-containing protein [Amycolatopsis sp. YIM 10]|uniref:LytTR family DNA-binding domain-containing protein n=1 Tax=Amycolatopsis sp. YIM 10 TaxID=2653857 RepID=UPI00129073D0|nr:LytTR family DNA-binding domain-containing protein [Amycolatopsis sp. YIM 10]QFU91594.1 CO-responsive transcriptional regulator RcoM [Amycolatopsis sp. YIM 10]
MPDDTMPECDPLLEVPLRLYLLCCLTDARWQSIAEVAGALDEPVASIISHVKTLKWTEYLETKGEGCGLEMRLTDTGVEQLGAHVAALETVVGKAARLSAKVRRRCQPAETVPVKAEDHTWFLKRAEVRFAEAVGDNVRLHTPTGVHLVRVPISRLTRAWEPAFARVHRSYLVAVDAVGALHRMPDGGTMIQTDCGLVPVSRRRLPALRGELLRMAR